MSASTPFIGEIYMFAGNFAPRDWAFCNGQLLPISEYETLFAVIGTTYGGDGQTTFALPDLRSRVPVHQGTGPGLSTRVVGESAGIEVTTITASNLPAHSHAMTLSGTAAASSTARPGSATMAVAEEGRYATGVAPNATLGGNSLAMSSTGGSQPHENRQPYLAVNFIISLFGIFPSPN